MSIVDRINNWADNHVKEVVMLHALLAIAVVDIGIMWVATP
jgi:hypothetical protein